MDIPWAILVGIVMFGGGLYGTLVAYEVIPTKNDDVGDPLPQMPKEPPKLKLLGPLIMLMGLVRLISYFVRE